MAEEKKQDRWMTGLELDITRNHRPGPSTVAYKELHLLEGYQYRLHPCLQAECLHSSEGKVWHYKHYMTFPLYEIDPHSTSNAGPTTIISWSAKTLIISSLVGGEVHLSVSAKNISIFPAGK